MRRLQILIISIIAMSALISIVSASGVVTEYWNPDHPLNLQPGESKEVHFYIQNGVGDTDITMRALIVNGSDIAKIIDSNTDYFVPVNGSASVNVRITMPLSATPGYKQDFGISFTSVTPSEKGQFALGSAFEKHFDVTVPAPAPVEEQTTNINSLWVYLIVAIVIIVLVIVFIKRSNKN